MLQSIKQMLGDKLGASDGDIGHVKDFYFDDENWVVRYLVADSGSWLPGRKVLLSPRAIGELHLAGKVLQVNLTREKVRGSPSIEAHQPVTRQHEEEYHRYYGWPAYWLGDGIWGMSGVAILESPANPLPGAPAAANGSPSNRADAHLRSTQAVTGYHLQASDGIIGHVCDFLMDEQSWKICQLVIRTGHRFTGKEVTLPVSQVDRLSYDESTVFVNMTKEAIKKCAALQPIPTGAIV